MKSTWKRQHNVALAPEDISLLRALSCVRRLSVSALIRRAVRIYLELETAANPSEPSRAAVKPKRRRKSMKRRAILWRRRQRKRKKEKREKEKELLRG